MMALAMLPPPIKAIGWLELELLVVMPAVYRQRVGENQAMNRQQLFDRLAQPTTYDLAIIGGGADGL